MRLIVLFIIIFLNGCNPQKMEKLGDSLTTTGKVLEALAPVFNKLDEVIYDFEYDGEMKNGKRHGYGTYIWKDEKFKGTKYVGYHKDNKMHGQGVITFPNGEKYVGRFIYDKYDGEGTYFYKNGTKQEGIWRGGYFVYPKKIYSENSHDNQLVKVETHFICDKATTIDGSWTKDKDLQEFVKEAKRRKLNCSNETHSHSKNTDVSDKEELGFWGKTDKFLGQIADGFSKEDTITGLRTLDKPFHNEEDYRKQGEKTFNLILNKARKQNARILSETDLNL